MVFEALPILRHCFQAADKTGNELLVQAENAALWQEMNIKGLIFRACNNVEKAPNGIAWVNPIFCIGPGTSSSSRILLL